MGSLKRSDIRHVIGFDHLAFILGDPKALDLYDPHVELAWEVLLGVIKRTTPHFRYLFRKTLQEEFGGVWQDVKELPSLPEGLTPTSKCLRIQVDGWSTKNERFVIVDRNGGLFLWKCNREGEQPSNTIVALTKHVFEAEWITSHEASLVVKRVTLDLRREFNGAANELGERSREFWGEERWLSATAGRMIQGS
ncbi:MAG: hypothetical protein HYW97_00650 [Candidatus Wildermuthbacteria bacterium]|nr:hypothetical protein [Candidatus Wildermuthbacteria bacterium]